MSPIFALAFACRPEDPPDRPSPTTPFDAAAFFGAPGPHQAGWREISVSWTDPLLDEPRVLPTNVWYPTDDTTGDRVLYVGSIPDDDALGGATVIEGSLPLVVFSHGHQGFGANSAFLMRHLASHGWVVVAPDHTDNTTFDGSERTTEIYWERPLDLVAAVDAARAEWAVRDEIGAVGHSFGGFTMHASGGAPFALDDLVPACLDGTDTSDFCSTMDHDQADHLAQDLTLPGLRATVAMAPGDFRLFGAEGVGAMTVPELLLTGGLDPSTTSDGDLVWDALPEGKVGLHIPTMGHQGFTDFSGTLGDPPGSIDPEAGFVIVQSAVAAWLAAEVLGDERGRSLLDGSVPWTDLAEARE